MMEASAFGLHPPAAVLTRRPHAAPPASPLSSGLASAAASPSAASSTATVPRQGSSAPQVAAALCALCVGAVGQRAGRRSRRSSAATLVPRPAADTEKPYSQYADRFKKGTVAGSPPASHLPGSIDDWTDYTRFALGVEDRDPDKESPNNYKRVGYLFDRRRALGVDFGPQFVGLALSLGGVNTMPMGTLQTGEDWQDTALRIARIASTRRVEDIVIGLPYEMDGSEGTIARLVRHFAQILADAVLLVRGPSTAVFVWDERFSTTYAAMRMATRPHFDGMAFKSWLDGQRGLNFTAKCMLDSQAARAILEHWLDKDPDTEVVNKELSERIAPSREACVAYLKWKKAPLLKPVRPLEPAGPGKEGHEFDYQHDDEDNNISPEEYMSQAERYHHYMEGMDNFGDRTAELDARIQATFERKQRDKAAALAREDRERVKAQLKVAGWAIKDSQKRGEAFSEQIRDGAQKYLSGDGDEGS